MRTANRWWRACADEWRYFCAQWTYAHPVYSRASLLRLVAKRAADVAVSAAGLIIAAPLGAVIAVLVTCSSRGPMIYAQERVGRHGRPFTMYKFRTMIANAEADGPVWSLGHADRRITPVGAWLRRTHLDELPQLWNVLRGDMSLVGPRPERPAFVERLDQHIPQYYLRHRLTPGLTGLAQVHYRYDATLDDVRRKLRWDLFYGRHMCPGLDLKILWKTAGMVLVGQGQ